MRLLLAAVALVMVLGWQQPAGNREPPVDWLSDCSVPQVPMRAWCGSFAVREDRSGNNPKTIDLNIVVLPAAHDAPTDEAVFFLHGGPGAAATDAVAGIGYLLDPSRDTRDLVFVDQRGTGRSSPLACPPPANVPLQWYFREFLEPDDVTRCLEVQETDVRLYTTSIAAVDINEVRQALGYRQINLYGGSYGSRAAQVYMRSFPETVRSAVLKGISPTSAKNPLTFARAAEAGFAGVVAACAAQPDCAATFPDLADDWQRALAHFDDGPVAANLSESDDVGSTQVTIARGVFADGIRHILYTVQRARRLPVIVHAAAAGDFDVFAREELADAIGWSTGLSRGVFLTVTCSEFVRFIEESEIDPATEGTFMGDYRVRRQQQACRLWPLADVDPSYLEVVDVDVPTLLMSGQFDTATPPNNGELLAQHLPNSRHIVFPNQSHGFADFECSRSITNQMIATADPAAIDASCVQQIDSRPDFFLEEIWGR